MGNYEENLKQEKAYLKKVMAFLQEEIGLSDVKLSEQKQSLMEVRKEMWQEGPKASDEFDRIVDLSQYFALEAIETSKYKHKFEKLKQYQRMVDKPYFGRFDFTEEGEEREAIYIGYHNLMNDDTYEVMVYDWRAPISSMFYRNELGKASYNAPCGSVEGEVYLKRQFEIKKSELEYFFDCSVTIKDEMLQQALGKNASMHMHNIVETIQKEQDQIIRDKTTDLLMVQGVAGSGKTSIALHRVAFLLYDRLDEGLKAKNIIIISPNQLFGEYISNVLPELGEEQVAHMTMEDIFSDYFSYDIKQRDRFSQLEYLLRHRERKQIRDYITFKGSELFCNILDRMVKHLEQYLIPFEDIYYDNECIVTKDILEKEFLDNQINMSITKRLSRLEQRILAKIKPLEKRKCKEVEKYLEESGDLGVDEEESVQFYLDRYKQETIRTIYRFTKIDYTALYERLFNDDELWEVLTQNMQLPSDITVLRKETRMNLQQEYMPYEDSLGLLYLRISIEGGSVYPSIRQVVVDEAQDYYPIHYKLFAMLFKGAQFTVIGDLGQTIEKEEEGTFYDQIKNYLMPKSSLKLNLDKSYRSSYEINQYAKRLRARGEVLIAFERHEQPPIVKGLSNEICLVEEVITTATNFLEEGMQTVVILCKTNEQVDRLYSQLEGRLVVKKMDAKDIKLEKGIILMPIYMAKGLEYDGVILYEVNETNYHEPFDRQLLYVGCTRALHRLSLLYTGQLSRFLVD